MIDAYGMCTRPSSDTNEPPHRYVAPAPLQDVTVTTPSWRCPSDIQNGSADTHAKNTASSDSTISHVNPTSGLRGAFGGASARAGFTSTGRGDSSQIADTASTAGCDAVGASAAAASTGGSLLSSATWRPPS
ncbi:MAG TPA: hypothetical protein VGF17_22155 [Phytomonospora sp.]